MNTPPQEVHPKFAKGDRVCALPGVTDPEFPDFPMGGWSGEVVQIYEDQSPPTYLVHWNSATLKAMHPALVERCHRDGLDWTQMGLAESDLKHNDGHEVTIEQPTNIQPRPLLLEEPEDRVRVVFGLTSDDPLPSVGALRLFTSITRTC